jgi:hypothetical protein
MSAVPTQAQSQAEKAFVIACDNLYARLKPDEKMADEALDSVTKTIAGFFGIGWRWLAGDEIVVVWIDGDSQLWLDGRQWRAAE